jgi:capsular polysaccharide biosynthesis protein
VNVKEKLFKVINTIVDSSFTIIDFRQRAQDVEILSAASSLKFTFAKVHGIDRHVTALFSGILSLDPLFCKRIDHGKIVGNGIVLNQQAEIVLESTLFQREYLNKLNQKHLILFRNFLDKKRIGGVMISLSNILENNYYHWIMESLMRMMLVDEYLKEDTFFVIDNTPSGFKTESLRFLFHIPNEKILQKKTKEVFEGQILVPSFAHTRNENTHWVDICNPHFIRKINARAHERIKTSDGKPFPKKFILSREGTTERQILNAQYLLDHLPNDSFSIIDTNTLSFEDQVLLFFNAELVISTHGAGLTNIIFGRRLTVIELFPEDRKNTDQMVFVQISEALGFDHYLFTYTSCNDRQDLMVDSTLLNKILPVVLRPSN